VGTRQEELDENHFNCLNKFMWSENSAVKILPYRLLNYLGHQDLIDMMYLEENKLNWVKLE
jgi:protein PhnA